MTEREKMLRGLLYDSNAPELCRARDACKDLCHALNQLPPSRETERRALLRELLGGTKENFYILSPFLCDYGANIRVGENVFFNHGCVILDCAPVTFGDNVFVGPSCGFYTAAHPLDPARRNQGLEYAKPITVEDDVWLGGGVTVLPGVTIGRSAVIGAGSVVTRDIPPGVTAAGNPCRVLRAISGEA